MKEFKVFKKYIFPFSKGGDIINNDGSGQTSIWRRLFEDENFLIKHSEPGIVSMVNNGEHKKIY